MITITLRWSTINRRCLCMQYHLIFKINVLWSKHSFYLKYQFFREMTNRFNSQLIIFHKYIVNKYQIILRFKWQHLCYTSTKCQLNLVTICEWMHIDHTKKTNCTLSLRINTLGKYQCNELISVWCRAQLNVPCDVIIWFVWIT